MVLKKKVGVIRAIPSLVDEYLIESDGVKYSIKSEKIISSEREDKLKDAKDKLIEQKIKIANAALKMRDALYCDHLAHAKESRKEYDKRNEELFDFMSEYDELEDKYIMLGGEKTTY